MVSMKKNNEAEGYGEIGGGGRGTTGSPRGEAPALSLVSSIYLSIKLHYFKAFFILDEQLMIVVKQMNEERNKWHKNMTGMISSQAL